MALRAFTLRNRCMMALENEWQTELQALNFFPDLEEKKVIIIIIIIIYIFQSRIT